jgi:hypothetical protein
MSAAVGNATVGRKQENRRKKTLSDPLHVESAPIPGNVQLTTEEFVNKLVVGVVVE